MRIGLNMRFTHDTPDGAGVDDEVLPELLGRAYAGLVGDASDVGGAEKMRGRFGVGNIGHRKAFDQYQLCCIHHCLAWLGLP